MQGVEEEEEKEEKEKKGLLRDFDRRAYIYERAFSSLTLHIFCGVFF